MNIKVNEPVYLEKFEDLKKDIKENNVILLGAPTVGKTENLIKLFNDNRDVLFICELGSKIEKAHRQHLRERLLLPSNLKQRLEKEKDLLSKYSIIIIDDFYKVFQECKRENSNESILKILNRKKGVCIVSTPYRLEWLIKRLNEENLKWLENFTKKSKCKLLAIQDEQLAKNILKEFITKEEIVNKIVVNCKWGYDFEDDLLREKFRENSYGPYKYRPYETYTPYAFIQFINPDDKYGFIDETILKVLEHSSFTAIHNYLHHIYEGVAEDIKPLLSIGAGISGVAIPLVIIYAIYQMQKGKSSTYDNVKNSFGNLQYLTYPQLEKLEKEAGLPPLALVANKQILSINQNEWQKIEDLIAHHTEIVELVEKQDQWEEFVVKLEQLEKINNNINEFVRVGDVINKAILNSVDEDLEIEYGPQIELRNLGIIPKDFKIKTVGRDGITEEIITQIKGGRRLIILKGSGGIGKTTLALHIAKKLKEDGYFVGVPIPKNFSFLEYRLKGVSWNSNGIALFSEYRIAPTIVDEILIELLKLLAIGAYNCLVIVCRDEVYRAFEDQIIVRTGAFGGESTHIRNIFNEKEIIQVMPVDIEQIIRQIWNDENVLQNMKEIKIVSEGNPLYAILAAHWINCGNSLFGITKYELIYKYVRENVLNIASPDLQDAYLYIASVQEIEKEDLKEILNLGSTKWEKTEKDLQSYLKGTIYRLYPDVFRDVIFQEKCLPNLTYYIDILSDYPKYFLPIAENLVIAYSAANELKDGGNFSKIVVDQANIFIRNIKNMDVGIIPHCINIMILARLPIDLDYIDIEKLINEFERIVKIDKDERDEQFIEMFFSGIVVNISLRNNPENVTLLINKVEKKFKDIAKEFNILLENFYSGIIALISLEKNPEDSVTCFNEIEKRVKEAAKGFKPKSLYYISPHIGYTGVFLLNFYSGIIASMSLEKNPEDSVTWFNEIEKRVKEAAKGFKYPDAFIFNFYLFVISKIFDIKNSEDVSQWFNHIEKRIKETEQDVFYLDPISIFYAETICEISYKKNLKDSLPLVNKIEKKAKETAKESKYTNIFILTFYSKIVEKISTNPEWINEIKKRIEDAAKEFNYPDLYADIKSPI